MTLRYKEMNEFQGFYHNFKKCLKWMNDNYEALTQKDREEFHEKVAEPMEEAWQKLSEEEKELWLKDPDETQIEVKEIIQYAEGLFA